MEHSAELNPTDETEEIVPDKAGAIFATHSLANQIKELTENRALTGDAAQAARHNLEAIQAYLTKE